MMLSTIVIWSTSLLVVRGNILGEHCVDVSTYDPVVYHNGTECCKRGVGPPKCDFDVVERMIVHNETICRVEIHDKTTMAPLIVNTTMIVNQPQEFQPWNITMVPHVIKHTKYNFTCVNKTRQNCITNWVTNPDGTKVSVPGDCEDVVWLDCFRTPYEANFTTMKHQKIPLPTIKYQTCREMTMPVEQMTFFVDKVAVSVCDVVPRKQTVRVQTKFCVPQLGPEKCQDSGLVPWQRRIHKEKCLQPGDPRQSRGNNPEHHGDHGDHGHHGDHEDHGHHEGHEDLGTSDTNQNLGQGGRGGRSERTQVRKKVLKLNERASKSSNPRYLIQDGLNNPGHTAGNIN